MWILFHFIFLYICDVSPLFHIVAVFVALTMSHIHIKKLSMTDIVPTACLLAMYIGFYLTRELYHWAYLPWWVTTICGFRKQTVYIWAGGVLLGVLLYLLSWKERIGHVIMNLALMMKTQQQSATSMAIVHAFMAFLFGVIDWNIQNAYVDILAGCSAIMCAFFKDNMSWISLGALFTHPLSGGLCILHAGCPFWYHYYKNNHFRRVKYTYYFIYPVIILSGLFFREEIIQLRNNYSI